jgi:hypothetical protein
VVDGVNGVSANEEEPGNKLEDIITSLSMRHRHLRAQLEASQACAPLCLYLLFFARVCSMC